jgi:lipopolysaccharide export system protein LptC
MTARQILLALALAVAAILSGWLLLREQERNAAPRFTGPPRSDYQLQDFELASYAESGKLAFRLRAPRLSHDDAREAFHVELPVFQFFNSEGSAWNATSRRALISTRSKTVAMRERVRVTQAAQDSGGEFKLETEALDADTSAKKITTNSAVTMRRPGSILQGIGLMADLDTRQFELTSAVRGRFEVHHD